MATHIQNATIKSSYASPQIGYRISYTTSRSGYNVTYNFTITSLLFGGSSTAFGTGYTLTASVGVGGVAKTVALKSSSDIWKGGSSGGTAKSTKNVSITCTSQSSNEQQTVSFSTTRESGGGNSGKVSTSAYYVQSPSLSVITISLDPKGGSGGTSKIYFVKGVNNCLFSDSACTKRITSISLPTRTGYTFTHYYSDGSAGGGSGERYIYADGTFASDLCSDINASTTLYALWTPKKYTITYHSNNADGASIVKAVDFGSTYKTEGEIFTPQLGYQFVRWYTTPSGTGGNSWTGWTGTWDWTYDVNVYAQWAPIIITYDYNDGTGRKETVNLADALQDSSSKMMSIYEKDYHFGAYWASNSDGLGQHFDTDMELDYVAHMLKKSTTLYAHWNESHLHIALYSGNADSMTFNGEERFHPSSVPGADDLGYIDFNSYTDKLENAIKLQDSKGWQFVKKGHQPIGWRVQDGNGDALVTPDEMFLTVGDLFDAYYTGNKSEYHIVLELHLEWEAVKEDPISYIKIKGVWVPHTPYIRQGDKWVEIAGAKRY